ncbi:hypothetical protein A3B32_01175 [Candidatus Uhrbacteria bacterium RIFCSPLOWO2_01_FULL_53_9]|uniref:NAD-dependent epimerase/dehydratase domain-containing protein n=2 Tax=Candidatus Uhriibacteriota TaxID=1752732 RepID=A0A1F7UWX1_9BACT|nr:MAG: hypothetical protein A3C17_00105 [Candidatus Uhrbacteria bacterium RIFCSPHIGHO2_02_FULL_53_13]OGL82790.1 MAG: hypothetical protein A3B32_01175 [Candidatus Uhrbacteria bacterium RIFCSPLOWO2_01_FULL_53_9]
MEQRKEKVFVSGGAGFIGSHLVDRLIAEGHEVVVVDDLSTGVQAHVNPKATFHKMNVWSDYKKLYKLLQREKPDVAVHLAAHKDVRASVDEPIHDAHMNIIGTLNVLEGMRRAGGGRVVFSSSIAVYSQDADLPITETSEVEPSSPYGISKFAGEMYMWHYSESTTMACISLRLTNVYGPRQSMEGAGVITIFINQLLKGEVPTIFGNGEKTRDFIYVDDVVDAMMRSMRVAWCGELVIGTNVETSMNKLLQELQGILGTHVTPQYEESREGELYYVYADSAKAREVMGWAPKTLLSEGLHKTVEWFREHPL